MKIKGVNCPVYAVSNDIMVEDYKYDDAKALNFDKFFELPKDRKIVIGASLYIERKGS